MAIPRWVEWNYTAPGRPQPEPTLGPAQPYSRPGNLPRRFAPNATGHGRRRNPARYVVELSALTREYERELLLIIVYSVLQRGTGPEL